MKQLFKISLAALSTTLVMSCNSGTSSNLPAPTPSTEQAKAKTSGMSLEDMRKGIASTDDQLNKYEDEIDTSLKKLKSDTLCPQLINVKTGNSLQKDKDQSLPELDAYVEYFDNSVVHSNDLSSHYYGFNSFEAEYLGKKINSGMSKEEVKNTLGKGAYENSELLIYAAFDHIAFAVANTKEYYPALCLLFKDNKLLTIRTSFRHSTM